MSTKPFRFQALMASSPCWAALLCSLAVLPACGDGDDTAANNPDDFVAQAGQAGNGQSTTTDAGKKGTAGATNAGDSGTKASDSGTKAEASAPEECTATSCPEGQTCDTATKQCVDPACTPACSGATPTCNKAKNTCECTATSCGEGKSCQSGACAAASAGCTVADVAEAATTARGQIESNKKLPDNVSVCSKQVSTQSFLALSVSALLEINDGSKDALEVKEYDPAASPQDTTVKGKVPKSEYLDIATRVKKYMDANNRAPNYASDTSLGSYMGFTNLVYMYSMVLDHYNTSGQLADYALMELFSKTHQNPLDPFVGFAQINLTTDWGSCGSHSGGVSIAYLRGFTTAGQAEQVESDIYWKYGGRVYGGPGRSDLAASLNKYMKANSVPYTAFLFGDGDSVKGYIDGGTPVVANTSQWGGHYVAIYGIVNEGGTNKVYFSDGANGDGVSASLATGYLKKWNWSTLRAYVTSGYIGFKHN